VLILAVMTIRADEQCMLPWPRLPHASLHQPASVAESGDPTGVGPVVFTCRQGSGREGAILVQDTVAAPDGLMAFGSPPLQ